MSTKMDAQAMAWKRYENEEASFHRGGLRAGYADAVREVAQPLADQRDELIDLLRKMSNGKLGASEWTRVKKYIKVRAIITKANKEPKQHKRP